MRESRMPLTLWCTLHPPKCNFALFNARRRRTSLTAGKRMSSQMCFALNYSVGFGWDPSGGWEGCSRLWPAPPPLATPPPPRDAFKHLGEEAGNLGCAFRPLALRAAAAALGPAKAPEADAGRVPPPPPYCRSRSRGTRGSAGGRRRPPPREAAAPKEERRFSPFPSFFRLWCLLLTAPTAAAAFGALRGRPRRGGRGHLPLGQSSAPSEVLLSSAFGGFFFYFIKL